MAQLVNKAKNFVADKLASVKKPEAEVKDVSFKGVTRQFATFHSTVAIANPYDHDIPIGKISYSLKSAKREIASGVIRDPGSIVANKSTNLEVPVNIPYDVLLSLAKDVGKDWDIDYELHLGFSMHLPIVGHFTLPLTNAGEIKLPTLSDIF
ncbi:late embryogenesis abundant protein Lea14-A-like [Nymphaea colorata]|nr:late embryogenesis abundant protein Lea14-A-like [Nymphaea colorata]